MADKRIVIDTGDGAARVVASGPTISVEMPADDKPWTTYTWNGLPGLRCLECPWDTLDGEDAMWDHIRIMHAPPAPAAPASSGVILVADRWGNERPAQTTEG